MPGRAGLLCPPGPHSSGQPSAASQAYSTTPALHACERVSSMPLAAKQSVW